MVDVPLKCSCGEVAGTAVGVSDRNGTRIICYCDDCQAFARYLEREDDILTENGGTDIFQIYPCQFEITKGAENLRSLRLTQSGPLRWYTHCCKTAVGNTKSGKMPFIGVIHSFMDDEGSRDRNLGHVRYHVQGRYALGNGAEINIHPKYPFGLILRIARKLLIGKLRGKNHPNSLFDPVGKPLSEPTIVRST